MIRLANAKMAGAIRMVSLSLGADPRDFALFAFGGAGPLHAVALARELGVPRVLVPVRPGITKTRLPSLMVSITCRLMAFRSAGQPQLRPRRPGRLEKVLARLSPEP